MQPPPAERLDGLLLRLGLVDHRKYTRPFLKENEVLAVRVADRNGSRLGMKPEPIASGSTRVDPMSVSINGIPLDKPGPLQLIMNKPPGTVCTWSREEGAIVYDLLDPDLSVRLPRVATVGRLDRLASGLLLLTQSGSLLHRLTAPESHVGRTYVVRLQRPLSSDGREAMLMATGTLRLVDGHTCKPAVLEPHPADPTAARVTVFEGHHRLVRRAFSALGNRVLALHRSHFGPIDLASTGLLPGQSRHLGAGEVYELLRASARPTKRQLRSIEQARLRASRLAAIPEVPASLLAAVDRDLPRVAAAYDHELLGLPEGYLNDEGKGRARDAASGSEQGREAPEAADSSDFDDDGEVARAAGALGMRSSSRLVRQAAEMSPAFASVLLDADRKGSKGEARELDAFLEARLAVAARSRTAGGAAEPGPGPGPGVAPAHAAGAAQAWSDDDAAWSGDDDAWSDGAADAPAAAEGGSHQPSGEGLEEAAHLAGTATQRPERRARSLAAQHRLSPNVGLGRAARGAAEGDVPAGAGPSDAGGAAAKHGRRRRRLVADPAERREAAPRPGAARREVPVPRRPPAARQPAASGMSVSEAGRAARAARRRA